MGKFYDTSILSNVPDCKGYQDLKSILKIQEIEVCMVSISTDSKFHRLAAKCHSVTMFLITDV